MLARTIESRRFGVAATAALLIGVVSWACEATDTGQGTVRVMAYGEEFIEEGIAPNMSDGWAIEFDRFAVTIAGVEVGGKELGESVTVDLSVPSDGEGHEVGEFAVPAGHHDGASFEIVRLELEGRATRDDVLKTFQWELNDVVRYTECETTTNVLDGETATFQITIHADHLFYDSLVAMNPQLLFSPLADADANGDGEITSGELVATDIGSYDPGNEDAHDLWSFLVALNGTIGHVDGEGHCFAETIDD